MSSESARQHDLEFGGSHVHSDFDGTINFRLADAIPVITISYTFGDTTARQFRYLMGATLGPQEYHFHQRYQYLVVDLRPVTAWKEGAAQFMAEVRDALQRVGGELHVVTYDASKLAGDFAVHETVDEALDAIKETRQRARAR
jgi:hypothetical protein